MGENPQLEPTSTSSQGNVVMKGGLAPVILIQIEDEKLEGGEPQKSCLHIYLGFQKRSSS